MIGYWIALGVALTTTALGQVVLKIFAKTNRRLHFFVAIAFFVLAPCSSYFALRGLGIGTVYMSTSITQVMVLLLAWRLLQEQVTRDHLIAMALIIGGLILYTR